MGFATSGACLPDKITALNYWCAHVEPGSSAMSCNTCNQTASTCSVTWQPADATSPPKTANVPVRTPTCTEPDPIGDATAYTGAIIALWVAVWAARSIYQFFRVPHADSN